MMIDAVANEINTIPSIRERQYVMDVYMKGLVFVKPIPENVSEVIVNDVGVAPYTRGTLMSALRHQYTNYERLMRELSRVGNDGRHVNPTARKILQNLADNAVGAAVRRNNIKLYVR
jgi:hypothetical protein